MKSLIIITLGCSLLVGCIVPPRANELEISQANQSASENASRIEVEKKFIKEKADEDARRIEEMRQAKLRDYEREQDIINARRKYVEAHPERPERIKKAIISQDAALGMTTVELKLALSDPRSVTSHASAFSAYEIWHMRFNYVVMIENGLVTSVDHY